MSARELIDLRQGRISELKSSLGMFISMVVAEIIPKMQETDPTDTGGYFGVFDLATGLPLMVIPVGGFVSEEKARRYLTNCLEKGQRLSLMHRQEKHRSSWQSRDPDANPARYGGAIVIGPNLIFSFSGFSEHGDEWVSYLGAQVAGYADPPVCADLAEISDNYYLRVVSVS